MGPSNRADGTRRLTFLLSLWCDEGGCMWRAALRPGDGGPRLGFAGLDELVIFLLRLTDADATFTIDGATGLSASGSSQPITEPTTA